MAKGFSYQRRSADQWNKHSERSSGFEGFIKDDFKTWRPKKGDNAVRILPPTFEDANHYGVEVWVHYNIGPERASVLCLQKMQGKPCPACEERIEAQRAGDEDGAKELKPRNLIVTWILDKNEREIGNPAIWAIPGGVDTDICKISQDRRSGEVYEIDNPDDGYDVYFDKEGDGLKTRYGGFQLSKKTNEVPQKVLDYIEDNPLDSVLRWRSYEEIEKLLSGTPAPRKRRDDDDDRPSRRRDEDEERPRRSRDDDERPSRRAGRDEEERPSRSARDDDDRPSRRARDDDEEEPRSGRRGARDAEESNGGRRDRDEGNGATRRAGGRDADEERPARRRLNRDEDDEAELPRTSRSAALREQMDSETRRGSRA
jgi:hypothetical protein